MLTDPRLALQKAIVGALMADTDVKAVVSDRIYDRIPRDQVTGAITAKFPFIALGDTQLLPELAECTDAAETSMPRRAGSTRAASIARPPPTRPTCRIATIPTPRPGWSATSSRCRRRSPAPASSPMRISTSGMPGSNPASTKNVKITLGTRVWIGPYKLTKLNMTGNRGSRVTFDASLDSDGETSLQ
jgi:hypothetical protein